MEKHSLKGFTLVELLMVIVIIGIIVGVMIFHYFNSLDSARLAKAKDEVNTLCSAIGKFKSRMGYWPSELRELEYKGYIPKIPLDPWEGKYEIDLCFGVIGNYETSAPPSEGGRGIEYLRTQRFKPKQYFFTNNKTARVIDKYDVLGRKMKTIKLKDGGIPQNFSFGSFDVDEMDNIYIADLSTHTLRIFDGNGDEYDNEDISIGTEDIVDVEVGKSILTGRKMKIRNITYNPSARFATQFYILTANSKIRLYNTLTKKMMREIDSSETGYAQVSDIVFSGKLYVLPKNGSTLTIFDQNGMKIERVVTTSSSSENKGMVILSNNYFAILESNKKITLYRFDKAQEEGCYEVTSYSSDLSNPDKIAFDDSGFIYVKSLKKLNIIYFDNQNEDIYEYYGPVLKNQPVTYLDNLYDIRFGGLK